jgi:hypothetical protein
VILIDRLLISGVRFVLDKLTVAADSELNDTSRLHDSLLDAQMRLELGEISEEEFAELEATISSRLREIRMRERREVAEAGLEITGVEVSVDESVGES